MRPASIIDKMTGARRRKLLEEASPERKLVRWLGDLAKMLPRGVKLPKSSLKSAPEKPWRTRVVGKVVLGKGMDPKTAEGEIEKALDKLDRKHSIVGRDQIYFDLSPSGQIEFSQSH